MIRRSFPLPAAGALAALLSSSIVAAAADSQVPPNVVIVPADDLGDGPNTVRGTRFWEQGLPVDEQKREPAPAPAREVIDGGGPYPRDFAYQVAIAPEKGVTRRDPSDVIRVGESYYVWYSKVRDEPGTYKYPSGYSAEVWFASSPDGLHWTEQGRAVGRGAPGTWDEHGVFTPGILAAKGQFWLFYTGVAAGHDDTTPTRIGLAVADSPDGPWQKLSGNPILQPSDDAERFDSMRVDDACALVRDGRYWLYYKGRQQGRNPGQTKMGLAIADRPEGPYARHSAAPLHPGHEVLAWPHGWGVASLATAAGPRQVYFAPDGIHFAPRNTVAHPPQAPGAFRPEAFEDHAFGTGIRWGIDHATAGRDLYLRRFDCLWAVKAVGQARPSSTGCGCW